MDWREAAINALRFERFEPSIPPYIPPKVSHLSYSQMKENHPSQMHIPYYVFMNKRDVVSGPPLLRRALLTLSDKVFLDSAKINSSTAFDLSAGTSVPTCFTQLCIKTIFDAAGREPIISRKRA